MKPPTSVIIQTPVFAKTPVPSSQRNARLRIEENIVVTFAPKKKTQPDRSRHETSENIAARWLVSSPRVCGR